MIYLLIHHEVADYSAWKSVFDSSLEWRTRNGERNCRIFRGVQNPNELTLLFEWEAGVKGVPQVEYLNEMFSIRRSAAD